MQIYNSLTRQIEEFIPLNPPKVGMYACGPTVYDYQHIGHMRRYVGDDLFIRVLKLNGYDVKHVMNITDVGHLVSDSDTGEDKMEKGAKKFGMDVWELANKFEDHFFKSLEKLSIKKADIVVKATDHIKDQIDLIEILTEKGYTYKTADGIYFDTKKFPDYNKLTGQRPEELKPGARVKLAEGKRYTTDFALWKFSIKDEEKRQMEWYFSGKLKGELVTDKNITQIDEKDRLMIGFPGWHIECSAMAMLELGSTFDIHTGGVDHISIHHTNEIAQSEAATGKTYVKYWVHHAFLMVEGVKMSKSIGNLLLVDDIIKKGYEPLALRYLFLQTHYRQEMNFTFKALDAAQVALKDLWEQAKLFGEKPEVDITRQEPSQKVIKRWEQFQDAINHDMHMPEALAALQKGLKEAEDDFDIMFLLSKTDDILGFNIVNKGVELYTEQYRLLHNPTEEEKQILEMLRERDELRKQKRFHLADQLRNKIENMGYEVIDAKKGKSTIRKAS